MKNILNDIELDFYELKCFLDFIEEKPQDKKLQKIALRALNNLSLRVTDLKADFESKYNDEVVDNFSKKNLKATKITPSDNNIQEETSYIISSNLDEISEEKEAVVENKVLEASEYPEDMPDLPCIDSEQNDFEDIEDTVVATSETTTVVEPHKNHKEAMYNMLRLNDVFYYTRELFDGDGDVLREQINNLENCKTYEEAHLYVIEKISSNVDSEAFKSLDDFLKKYFN